LQYSRAHYEQLIAGGIDPTMARHVAHMFVRDPLQVYKERIVQVGQVARPDQRDLAGRCEEQRAL